MPIAARAAATLGWLALAATVAHSISVPVPPLNSSIASPSKTPSGDVPSTITHPPVLPSFSGQVIPINTCSYWDDTEGSLLWNKQNCSVIAGTVKLTYWPTHDNYSYPSTFYDRKLNYTFTSPSVYMIVNTLYATNKCGALGPTFTSRIFAFDITNVSTLAPYTDKNVKTSRTPRQLYLDDLGVNCPTSVNLSKLKTMTHPMENDDVRCNPSLLVPIDIKRAGYPYWKHCGNKHFKFGLFDPPYAIPPADAVLDPITSTATGPVESRTDSPTAAPKPTAVPEQAAATSTASPQSPTDPPSPNHPVNPAIGPSSDPTGVIDKSTDVTPSSVATVIRQIVSLGPSGIVIVNPDGTSTTSVVPAIGGAEGGSEVAPASSAVYRGHTLTAGGGAVTITNGGAVMPPTGSAGANVSGHSTVVTAAAARMTESVVFGLVMGLLALGSLGL